MVQFAQWRNWPHIFALSPIAIVGRPGTLLKAMAAKPALRFANRRVAANACVVSHRAPVWTLVATRYHPASSTALRAASQTR